MSRPARRSAALVEAIGLAAAGRGPAPSGAAGAFAPSCTTAEAWAGLDKLPDKAKPAGRRRGRCLPRASWRRCRAARPPAHARPADLRPRRDGQPRADLGPACHIQAEMFEETAALGGLDVQLVYYRGFGECEASPWLGNAADLPRRMTGVRLPRRPDPDRPGAAACHRRDQGQEGRTPWSSSATAWRKMPTRSATRPASWACWACPSSCSTRAVTPWPPRPSTRWRGSPAAPIAPSMPAAPSQLRELLGAVAVYAAGGRQALEDLRPRGRRRGLAADPSARRRNSGHAAPISRSVSCASGRRPRAAALGLSPRRSGAAGALCCAMLAIAARSSVIVLLVVSGPDRPRVDRCCAPAVACFWRRWQRGATGAGSPASPAARRSGVETAYLSREPRP